jgi:hypothetical protein
VEAKKKRKRKRKKKKSKTTTPPPSAIPPVAVNCLSNGDACGSGLLPCCNASGLVRCEMFPANECSDLTGFHCCGGEGEICDPNFGTPTGGGPTTFGNCSCCSPLFCGKQLSGEFRCQAEDT